MSAPSPLAGDLATPVPATTSGGEAESMMVVVTGKRVYHISRDKLMKPEQETNPAPASSELVLPTSRVKVETPVEETNQYASGELVL